MLLPAGSGIPTGPTSWSRTARPPCSTPGRSQLHPDLALLLVTSGSTGSTKLVRLSHRNLRANSEAIIDYLAITPDDRAITSLPVHYSYGFSVVASHLEAGASLVVTEHSVADPCFWTLANEHEVTSFAGVPYSYDLIERGGFLDQLPGSLRTVTQAGGPLPAAKVVEWSERGRANGFDFYVMYGQTEATARMGYLPPSGGRFRAGCHRAGDPGWSFPPGSGAGVANRASGSWCSPATT